MVSVVEKSNSTIEQSLRDRRQEALEEPLPENYEADPEVAKIIELATQSTAPLVVLGKAGTGKSTLLRYLSRLRQFRNHALLAPTGVAALKISGQTIHSFFHLPPAILDRNSVKNQRVNRAWKNIDTILIDEISMVRADVVDTIDWILKRERNEARPFGGVRTVMFGDFFQLPPVADEEDRKILTKMGYESPFAFHSRAFQAPGFRIAELSRVHRQSEHDFIDILNDIRSATCKSGAIERLNLRCHRDHREKAQPVLLTSTNARASTYNNAALDKIQEPAKMFEGTIAGEMKVGDARLMVPEKLSLKVGARVIAMKNDPERKWVNGSLGTVTRLLEDSVLVTFDDGEAPVEVRRATWIKSKHVWDDQAKRIHREQVGSYSQVPLNLAWAITIHKAQGLSLDNVRIDLSDGAFASGQVYVALSRARTLSGLSLSSPIAEGDVFFDRHVKDFYERCRAQAQSSTENGGQKAETSLQDAMKLVMARVILADRNRDVQTVENIRTKLLQRGIEIELSCQGIAWRFTDKTISSGLQAANPLSPSSPVCRAAAGGRRAGP